MWAERRRPSVVLWLMVGALHLGVFWLLNQRRVVEQAVVPSSEFRLIALRVLPVPAAPAHQVRRDPAAGPSPVRLLPARPSVEPSPAPPGPTIPMTQEVPTEPIATEALQLPAPRPSLLTSEATRRAVREAGRTPLLAERTQAATGLAPRETEQQRLGREIQLAGDRDCLKGEFFGAGLGPFSLPFWALAEMRGKCRR